MVATYFRMSSSATSATMATPALGSAKETKLNKFTISKLANKKDHIPSGRTMKKILEALRKIDPNVRQDDFWSM